MPSTSEGSGIEVAGMWRTHRQSAGGWPRVIVVGAGFAGLTAVAELHREGAAVLLVDRNSYSTFQPLLYQVATGGLNPGDVAYPLHALTRKKAARFRPGELAGVDPAAAGSRSPTAAARLRLPGARHRGVGRLLRGDRRGREHLRPVHAARRGHPAGPHHGPAGTARHRRPGPRRPLHRGRWRGYRRRAGRCPGRAAQHRADAASPRWTWRRCISRWSRWPPRCCRRSTPAAVRAPGTARRAWTCAWTPRSPRSQRPGDPGGRGQGAQRCHRVGGRGVRTGRGEGLGPAAGPGRPHPGRPGPAGRTGRTGSSPPGTSR